ncbi:hypothetical protein [Acidithiobacillus thiooxidans]|uniref:hypothetical protein n=1 Tax=Acidithiobacillus thiooxidans TaxID=930 RepID=UPI00046597DF|nr:hypothetical protein [Acidithiobacillus thiooxidans]
MPTYLGIDFGTSGLRGVIIDENLNKIASAALPYPGCPSESLTDSQGWLQGLEMLAQQLRSIHTRAWSAIKAMSLDGASGTSCSVTDGVMFWVQYWPIQINGLQHRHNS